MDLFPLSFFEFLTALGKTELRTALEDAIIFAELSDPIHELVTDLLKYYYIVGGMPEAVRKYLKNESDLESVRKVQRDILDAYELDFVKHAEPHEAIKISKVWGSLSAQLAKENKKFMFSKIQPSARAREYEDSITWLENAGLILKAHLVSTPKIPLDASQVQQVYKVFLLDVGLLGAMSRLPPKIVLEKHQLFTEFKGAFSENFVAQELTVDHCPLYYWSYEYKAEMDFLLPFDTDLVPLEVKSDQGRNMKSLQFYSDKFHPNFLMRTSLRNYRRDKNFINIPLYLISQYKRALQT